MKPKIIILTAILIVTVITITKVYQDIALLTTPSKKALEQTGIQKQTDEYFWQQFHASNYDSIPQLLNRLTAAYLENPNNFNTTAHLAFTHIWLSSERSRNPNLNPEITNHIILSRKYFNEAYNLNLKDARIHGFLATTYLSEGAVDKDEKKMIEGYFMIKKAIKEWPEFNYFTGGYVLSQLSKENKRFAEAVEWQWKNLDACACEKVDRKTGDYSKYMTLETYEGEKRVCWNSWIAPHNFEGFFMNMGDMLVKKGDWQIAIKIYNNTKLSKTYSDWKYKETLEERIKNAEANVTLFDQTGLKDDNHVIMVNTKFSCMGCHRN